MWVSMVLTSTPHRHHTSRRNRSIPTILADYFHYRAVDVSTVDTEPPAILTPRGRDGGARSPRPPLTLYTGVHWNHNTPQASRSSEHAQIGGFLHTNTLQLEDESSRSTLR